MAADPRRRNLGRGLSALLGDDGDAPVGGGPGGGPRMMPIEFLRPGRLQPRHAMNDEQLRELAQSIADKGVLQPLLVRPLPDADDSYEIIAGERRWRAAQLAQVHEVPVIVRDLDDRETLEIALIENLQREDLSPLDEADGYRRLREDFSYTQAALATALGKSRSHVANTLRLLNLPDPVKEMVERGTLSAGHARALINAKDVVGLARTVARRGLNVRQTEKLVQAEQRPRRVRKAAAKDPNTAALERDLSTLLGLKVGIRFDGGAGTLTIHYGSLEQLDDILHRLTGRPGQVAAAVGEDQDEPVAPVEPARPLGSVTPFPGNPRAVEDFAPENDDDGDLGPVEADRLDDADWAFDDIGEDEGLPDPLDPEDSPEKP